MKIAIIFSGFFRTFDSTKESCLEHFIKPLNADVFFSTLRTAYAPPEHEVSKFHSFNSQNNKTIDSFIDILNPYLKLYEIRDYYSSEYYSQTINNNGLPEKNMFDQWHWRILSQMHNVSKAVSVFKTYVELTKKKYDLVILTRPDLKYHNNFNLAEIKSGIINYPAKSIYNGNISWVSANPSPSLDHPFNDQIIVGSQEHILKYNNIYDCTLGYVLNENIIFNPETIFGYHARKSGIPFEGSDFVLYEILRYES
jgi:hypothetical protein